VFAKARVAIVVGLWKEEKSKSSTRNREEKVKVQPEIGTLSSTERLRYCSRQDKILNDEEKKERSRKFKFRKFQFTEKRLR
jgi:hypothetical protein